MLCENCGKNEATVKYTEIINGNKKEMVLCEKCSKELGISETSFNMPIDFSNFFGDFLDEFEDSMFLPEINNIKELKCNNCGMTFNDFINNGKFGCSNCYNAFEAKINPLLKSIHGSDTHIGRLGKVIENKIEKENDNNIFKEEKKEENKNDNKIENLKQDLNKAIKEERYEDAAKIRDEIKKLEE